MACQRSTQTASNCQSNALSPVRRVPSLASAFLISARKSLDGLLVDSLVDSPVDSPASRLYDGFSRKHSGVPLVSRPENVAGTVSPEMASDSRLDGCLLVTSQPICLEKHQETTHKSTYPKESSQETLEPSLESSSLADKSFGGFISNSHSHNRLSSFSSDQQLPSIATFPKASSDFVAALIHLINCIFFIFFAGLWKFGHQLRHFRPQLELIELIEQFKLAFRRTAPSSSEISKAAIREQANTSEPFSRATISNKQPDYIIKTVSPNCRSFFKLWPFHFLLSTRSLFTRLHKSFRALPRNGGIQLLIILGISAAPVSANLKVSVQGDILLGGIFPVHQKGEQSKLTASSIFFITNEFLVRSITKV